MCLDIENTVNTSEIHNAERTANTIAGFSSDLIEEQIRDNLEPLNAQILTPT